MAASLLRNFRRGKMLKCPGQVVLQSVCRRKLLSAAYSCPDDWQKNLESPLLQKLDAYTFALSLQENIDRKRQVTAIDMDIMANKLHQLERHQLDFVQDLFYKFRHTKAAIQVRDSMAHALVRALLQFGEIDRLMIMLKDKVHYGIFLEEYAAKVLMDYFIKNQLYKEAGEIACDMMLQECLTNSMTRILAWYSAHLRLVQLCAENAELDDQNQPLPEPDEVKYRKVSFIQDPWYDDHFDIPAEHQRLGKVLVSLMKSEQNQDVLTRGYHLIGFAFYRKFEEGLQLLQSWADTGIKEAIARLQLSQFKQLLETVKTREKLPAKDPGLVTLRDKYPYVTAEQKTTYLQRFEDLSARLASAGAVAESIDIVELLKRRVRDTVSRFEPIDIAEQKRLYADWSRERQSLIHEQIKRVELEKKKRNIAERLLAMKAREEKLRYFDEKTKMDLILVENPPMEAIKDVVEEELFVAPPSERPKTGADAMKKSK